MHGNALTYLSVIVSFLTAYDAFDTVGDVIPAVFRGMERAMSHRMGETHP